MLHASALEPQLRGGESSPGVKLQNPCTRVTEMPQRAYTGLSGGIELLIVIGFLSSIVIVFILDLCNGVT